MNIDNNINQFKSLCQQVINSKFILSQQVISQLLKYVVTDEVIYSTVDLCMKNFDYYQEFSSSVIETGDTATFKLPYGNRKIVAMVLCLLYEFDNGKRNMSDFMFRYYPSLSANDSYSLMTKALILPFEKSLCEMVASKNDSIALSIDDTADRPLVSDGAISQVEHILRNINATIQEDQHLSIELKTDYLVLTDGLYHAMESRDLRTIKIIFIGFKHALANYKPCAKKAKDVEACLKLYMLI